MMRPVSRSAAGLAAKRTPAPGQAAGAVDLPGVLATAGRVSVRMHGTLALQRLAELALDLFLGTFRLRRGVSHADPLPGRRYPQLRTCHTGMPPGRVAGGDRRRRRTHCLCRRRVGSVTPAFPRKPSLTMPLAGLSAPRRGHSRSSRIRRAAQIAHDLALAPQRGGPQPMTCEASLQDIEEALAHHAHTRDLSSRRETRPPVGL